MAKPDRQPPSPLHTVLVVEDDGPTRAHLIRAIEAHDRLELRAAYGTFAEARRALQEADATPPDVLLTDLGLPDGNGIDLIRQARESCPDTQSMVVTVFGDEQSVIRSLEAGASGYLLKDGTIESIGASILELLSGGSPISPPIARYLLRRFQPGTESEEAPSATVQLTGRETEILGLIAKGFSFPEIARLLEISSHTVTTHVRHIYGKLEVNSRGEAVYEAMSQGIIKVGD